MHNKNYISVGIDVGSAFSFMTILAPDETVILKPFKITHNNKDSLERAVSEIKKAEELYSLESRTFLESTGIYHFPLFCYLVDCGFNASIINPIITHSTKNGNIRKVKNDKIDSKGIAKLGLSKDIPVSQFPAKLVLELRSLTRKYYDLTDERSAHINKLKGDLHTVFPQYLDVFCDVTGKTSTMILRQYGTPDKILRGHKKTMIEKISKEISDINYGIGSDGLILICKSEIADAKMIMYNKDGSEGNMCGNGIRCVAKYIYDKYKKNQKIYIETRTGIKETIINSNEIIVNMGYPLLKPENIPVNLEGDMIINKKISLGGKEININCVSMGNPHVVLFLDEIDNINMEKIATDFKFSNLFPEGCNIEFVKIIDSKSIKMRVYERGCGETFSCGTGACASVVAGILNNLLDSDTEIKVILKGGTLYVKYNDVVYLKGSTDFICKGKYLVKKH